MVIEAALLTTRCGISVVSSMVNCSMPSSISSAVMLTFTHTVCCDGVKVMSGISGVKSSPASAEPEHVIEGGYTLHVEPSC